MIGSLVGFAKPPSLDKLLKPFAETGPRPPMSQADIMHAMALWGAASRGR